MNGAPKSLQAMIADAQQALASWDDDPEDADDEGCLAAAKEWTARLGRGEYDQKLYWECVAEDCEAEANWEGAKQAYQRVIELEASGEGGFLSAHSDLAGLHFLLGDRRQALKHARLSRKLLSGRLESIVLRCAIVREVWLLLQMGWTVAARRLVTRGLNSFDDESNDCLGYATLQTLWAACDVAERRPADANESLQIAWSYLESLRQSFDAEGLAETASGLQGAIAMWHRVEAERRRLSGDAEGEVEAWQKALACSRLAATGWNRVSWDAAVMRALYTLSDAQRRVGRFNDAAATHAEAEEIRNRWQLPVVEAPRLGGDTPAYGAGTPVWRWLRSPFG